MRAEFQQNNKTRGQLLIESMIAISVMVVGLLGIFSLISQSLGLYRVAYEEYVAANLAAEGVEVVKNMIDTNIIVGGIPWNQGLASDGDFGVQYDSRSLDPTLQSKALLYDASAGLYNYMSGTSTNFRRVVTVKNVSSDEIQVNSTVTWKSKGAVTLNINLEDHFFNWR